MSDFDLAGARAYYSDLEIANYLASESNFNVDDARAHYSDVEIISHLLGRSTAPVTPTVTPTVAPTVAPTVISPDIPVVPTDNPTARYTEATYVDPDQGGFFNAFGKGVDNMQLTASSAVEGLGNVLGSETLQQYGAEGVAENEADLAASGELTRRQDVDDIGSGATYFAETLGQTLPQTGAGLLGGLAAGAAAGSIVPGLGTVAGGIIGLAGAALTQLPLFYGSNRERQKESVDLGIKTEINEGAAFLTAIPQALLDSVVDRIFIGKIPLFNKGMMKNGGVFTRVARGGAQGTVAEVPTELGQSLLERAQAGLSLDSDEAISEYLDVAIAAGMVGSALGGVGNVGKGPPTEVRDIKAQFSKGRLNRQQLIEVLTTATEAEKNNPSEQNKKVIVALTELLNEVGEQETQNKRDDVIRENILNEETITNLDDEVEIAEYLGKAAEVDLENDPNVKALPGTADYETLLAAKKTELRPTIKAKRDKEIADTAAAVATEAKTKEDVENAEQLARVNIEIPVSAYEDTPSNTTEIKQRAQGELFEGVQPPVNLNLDPETEVENTTVDTPDGLEADRLADVERNSNVVKPLDTSTDGINVSDSGQDGQLVDNTENVTTPDAGGVDVISGVSRDAVRRTSPERNAVIVDPDAESTTVIADVDSRAGELSESISVEDKAKVDALIDSPVLVTNDMLTDMGIRNTAPIRKRIIGKDVNSDFVKTEIKEFTKKNKKEKIKIEKVLATQESIKNAKDYAGRYTNRSDVFESAAGDVGLKIPDYQADASQTKAAREKLERKDPEFKTFSKNKQTKLANDEAAATQEKTIEGTGRKSGQENAKEFLAWAENNLSEDANTKIKERTKKYNEDRKNITTNTVISGKSEAEISENIATAEEVKKVQKVESALEAQKESKSLGKPDKKETLSQIETQADIDEKRNKKTKAARVKRKEKKDALTAERRAAQKKVETKRRANVRKTAESTLKKRGIKNPDKRQITNEAKKIVNAAEKKANAANKKDLANLEKELDVLIDLIGIEKKSTESEAIQDARIDRETTRLAEKFGMSKEKFETALTNRQTDRIIKTIFGGGLPLPFDAVVDFNKEINDSVLTALQDGDISAALLALGDTSISPYVAAIAKKLSNFAGTTNVKIVDNLTDAEGTKLAGMYDPKTNTISLDSITGINAHTIIHEMGHAITVADLNRGTSVSAKQLNKLFSDVQHLISTEYGATNIYEFVAEALGNESFRASLGSVYPDGKKITAIDRLYNILSNLIARIIGRKTKSITSALTEFDSVVEAIFAPAPNSLNVRPLNQPELAQANVGKIAEETHSGKPKINTAAMGDSLFGLVERATDAGKGILINALDGIKFSALVRSAGFGELGFSLNTLTDRQRGEQESTRDRLKIIRDEVEAWAEKNSTLIEVMDDIIYNVDYGATMYNVDPTKDRVDYTDKNGKGKLDESGNDLAEVWDEQQAVLKKLGGKRAEFLRIFKKQRDVYKDEFKELKSTLFKLVDGYGLDAKVANELKNNLLKKIFPDGDMDNVVYFPLQRHGDFVVAYNYTPTKKDGSQGVEKRVVERRETKREQDKLVAALSQISGIKDVKSYPKGADADGYGLRGDTDSGRVLDLLRANAGEGAGKVPTEVINQVIETIVSHAPEMTVAKSFLARKGVPGYDGSFIDSFRSKPFELAQARIKIKYTRELGALDRELDRRFTKLKEKLSAVDKDGNKINTDTTAVGNITQVVNSFQDRANFAKSGAKYKSLGTKIRVLNQIAFMYTIGFNVSSAIVQLFQIPLFAGQYLGAEYGYKDTAVALAEAMALVVGSRKYANKEETKKGLTNQLSYLAKKASLAYGVDVAYYNIDENGDFTVRDDINLTDDRKAELTELIPVIQDNYKRAKLHNNIVYDSIGLNEIGSRKKGILTKGLDIATALSGMMFNQSERFNRQVITVASYKLAVAKRKKDNKGKKLTDAQISSAVEEAYTRTQFTNGGTSLESGAPILREGLGRVAGMYKSYGLTMYTTMLMDAYQLIDSSLPDTVEGKKQKSIALKRVIGTNMSALFFSGVRGIPLYGAVKVFVDKMLLPLLGAEEEDDLTDDIVRRYVGEGFYKGAINELTGLNISDRIRLSGLLFMENRFAKADQTPEELAAFYAGGPALSTGKRLIRGYEYLSEGDMVRGVENLLPAGLANMVKGSPWGRYAEDGGMRTRKQDPIYLELGTYQYIAQFMGFAPAEYALIQEKNMYKKRVETAVITRRSDILAKMNLAIYMGDTRLQAEIWPDILEFNKDHPGPAEITQNTLDDSQSSSLKTRRKMVNGILINSQVADEIERRSINMFGRNE